MSLYPGALSLELAFAFLLTVLVGAKCASYSGSSTEYTPSQELCRESTSL